MKKRDSMHSQQFFEYLLAGEQLISSKISDKKFYSQQNDEHGEKIVKTVEKYLASRLICDNTKVKKVQRNIFHVPSDE